MLLDHLRSVYSQSIQELSVSFPALDKAIFMRISFLWAAKAVSSGSLTKSEHSIIGVFEDICFNKLQNDALYAFLFIITSYL